MLSQIKRLQLRLFIVYMENEREQPRLSPEYSEHQEPPKRTSVGASKLANISTAITFHFTPSITISKSINSISSSDILKKLSKTRGI